jgi:hypothetical protein
MQQRDHGDPAHGLRIEDSHYENQSYSTGSDTLMQVLLTLPPFCTREEFARLTGLEAKGQTVVLGMCNSATLPTVNVGRHSLVNVHQLLQDLQQGKTEFLPGDYS